ncbi:MAG: glycosyltransferase family 39 protein [Bryobacteraceae bacterium]|nr:glycosyltransferase family 39 protein [Bryobacteraceae bacterium]
MSDREATGRQNDWRPWAAAMVGLYVTASVAGLGRTLIGTEVWALYYAQRTLAEQFQAIRLDLVHPPLIYLIERGWIAIFGAGDTAVKALPVAINIPALILFTRLARLATARWRLAALLFTTPYLAAGSANTLVRMYGLLILLVLVAITLWERWRRRPDFSRLAAWTLAMVLMVYTHYFGLLMVAAFALVNWVFGQRRWAFLAAACVAGLSFAPWAAYVAPVYESRGLDSNLWWVHMLFPRPHEVVALMLSEYLGQIPGQRNLKIGAAIAAAFVHLALLVFAWRSLKKLWPPRRADEDWKRWFWVAGALAGVPVALLYAFSVVYTPAFVSRFLLGILPLYWLLVVMLSELGGRAGTRLLYGVILPWALVSAGIGMVTAAAPSPLRQRPEAIARDLRPSDLVLSEREHSNSLYWEIAHRQGRDVRFEVLPRIRRDESKTIFEQRGEEQGERLSVFRFRQLPEVDLRGVERVWLLHASRDTAVTAGAFLAERGFRVERREGDQAPFLTLFVRTPSD